jgi:hypothetical protein
MEEMAVIGRIACGAPGGLRMLTDAGVLEKDRRVVKEMKARGLASWYKAARMEWFVEIEREMFAPENEGIFWSYLPAVKA